MLLLLGLGMEHPEQQCGPHPLSGIPCSHLILVVFWRTSSSSLCGPQTDRMAELVEQSNGTLQLVRSRQELRVFIRDREADRTKIAALLGIEGSNRRGSILCC